VRIYLHNAAAITQEETKTMTTTNKVIVKFFDFEVSAKTEKAALNKLFKLYKFHPLHLSIPTRKQFELSLEFHGYEVITF
jgi:hypothetical protein